jgi:L-lactate dehydrogenase complex protein LldG
MSSKNTLVDEFTAKAQAVSAFVSHVASPEEALEKIMALCLEKPACELLATGCELPLSGDAARLCDGKQQKVLAAPGLKKDLSKKLAKLCETAGVRYVTEGMRDYVAGVDIGFTVADRAIAETGTMVFNSDSEDLRLATMVSEIHAALVPVSRIAPTAVAIAPELRKAFSGAPNYTAFVTGASRTADIERVLTLGVHGPLELHIYLWEDK